MQPTLQKVRSVRLISSVTAYLSRSPFSTRVGGIADFVLLFLAANVIDNLATRIGSNVPE
jgi:hypothetical protein